MGLISKTQGCNSAALVFMKDDMMKWTYWGIAGVMMGLCVCLSSAVESSPGVQPFAATPAAELLAQPFSREDQESFAKPARIYSPESWFHFIGGNVSNAGITADLEAIAAAGIGGIQLFHGQFGGAWPGVEPQIKCLSESWDASIIHAAKECRRLGLRFTMQNCPGWAMSGGPWITPENAMRHLVWSRTVIDESSSGSTPLAQPQPSKEEWRDYRDVAVIAFPLPEGDCDEALKPLSIKSNQPDLPWEDWLAKKKNSTITLEPTDDPCWIEFTFENPLTLRTVQIPPVQRMNHGWCYNPGIIVKVDALTQRGEIRIAEMKIPQGNWQGDKPVSIACREVKASACRITIEHKHSLKLDGIKLFTVAYKNNWEAEAGWVLRGLDPQPQPEQSKTAWIDSTKIIDLTDKMDSKNILHWTPPTGKWTVLRWGHVNTGRRNGPAPEEATGWECDKLSPKGAEAHFAGYIGRLAGKQGPLAGGLLNGMLLDSWECKTQTWTPGMAAAFEKARGYTLLPYLPALAGYVINDPETTTRFLRDYRSNINSMLVENFFGRLSKLGHENNLTLSFETACGDVFPGDILEYYKYADVPMCEFWQPHSESFVGSFEFKPVKPCVSAARMYGKPRVAAEAFTSVNLKWTEHPGMLKNIANLHLADGVTHLVFHTYTHNPRTDWLPPGTSFGAGIGTPFLRQQTWWKTFMPQFTAYLARCSYLLERGQPVSDVLWYLGDEQDHKPLQGAPFPAGYRYDYCNPDALLNRLSVKNGRLVTPEGISYRILWLPDCRRMLPETLERIVKLVKQGAIVVGEPPQQVATLRGGDKSEQRFNTAVKALWPDKPVRAGFFKRLLGGDDTIAGAHYLGRGCVISGRSIESALHLCNIQPDVVGEGVIWNHRQVDGADWYFVATPDESGFRGTLRFRSKGCVELWNPQTGSVQQAGVVHCENNGTLVALDLPASGSLFVVFRADKSPASTPVTLSHNGKVFMDASAPGKFRCPIDGSVRASYGDPSDPARRIDVTEKICDALERGIKSIPVCNSWAGSDPALKTPKKLFVTFCAPDGTETCQEVGEGQLLALQEHTTTPLSICQVLNGGQQVLMWKPGTYTLKFEDGSSKDLSATHARHLSLTGPWTLAFPSGWGAPASLCVSKLCSWTEMDLSSEAKAFSGTAIYTTEFMLDDVATTRPVVIDLGVVAVEAELIVNGKALRPLWCPPYQVDISDAVQAKANRLEIRVTNPWFNRLVYDASLPEAERKTWTIKGPNKDSKLNAAGLLGPVTIRIGEIQ